jgi:hypothetical protein
VRPQRVRLEHHRGAALLGRQRRNVAALDADGAGVRHDEAGDRAQSVVFPQPELPSNATISPRPTSRLTRSSTRVEPYETVRFSIER